MKCLRKAWTGCAILLLVFISGQCMAPEVPDMAIVEGITTGMCLIGIEPGEGITSEIKYKMGPPEGQSIDQPVDIMKDYEFIQYISNLPDLAEGFTGNGLESVEPLYVRSLTGIDRGHNDSNPVWSPVNDLIAFERSISDKKEILITQQDGTMIQKIYFQLSDNDSEMDFFFPGIFEEVSYNAGISWSPSGDRFVFMSNGGGGNYDLYMCELGSKTTKRLTEHKGRDSHAQWSPDGKHLIFVSGRTGKAEVYLMDLEDNKTTQITHGEREFLYPHWSPDGRKIVMIYGTNENHDIYLIGDVTRPEETLRAMTTWTYDDLRPVWSPDGQKIAFYSNYNPENDPKVWSIVVIAADASDPAEGSSLSGNVVAANVIPDMERGPAWMSDSKRIAYVKNDKDAYNPIYIVDIEGKASFLFKTDTKMNHDVACGINGNIAFRAQVEQWDHIYIAKVD